MPNDKNKTFTNPSTDEHVLEAERLKKAWFDHVLNSIERLAESDEKVFCELQITKNEFYKEISEVKDTIRKEINALHKDVDLDMDRLEKRLIRAIDIVSKTIDTISVKEVRDELKKDLILLKAEYKDELDSIKRDGLKPLSEDIVKLRIKMAKWGGLGGLIFSAIVFLLKWLVPIIISGIKHAQ